MKNAVFWDGPTFRRNVSPLSSWYKNPLERRQHEQLEPSAHADSSLADYCTLKIAAIHSSETSVHPRRRISSRYRIIHGLRET
jgi:hypothetical protein